MKTNSILVIFIFSTILFSCKSDYDKYIDEYKECSEKKKEEKKYKYANIQEALNAYDFEIAREYLACYPENNENLNNRTFYNEIFGGGDYDLDPKSKDLKQIVSAEITYFIAQGEFQKAESTAKEANLMDIYDKIAGQGFEDKLDEMVKAKEFEKIYKFLNKEKYKFQAIEYDLESDPSYSRNEQYNNSIRKFNALLDKVLAQYKYEKVDNTEITEVIDLSLPELVKKPWRQVMHSELKNLFKDEATKNYLKSSK
jgi:hypothetical protein